MVSAERRIEVLGRPARYLEVAPAAERRPPLLLVHGITVSADYLLPSLGALASAGRRVVAPDLPAHGGTGVPARAADLAVGGMVRFLVALLDRLGIGTADLLGHSYGGLVAARLALEQPARVRRLVLVASAGLARRVPLATAVDGFGRLVRWTLAGPPAAGEAPRWLCHEPSAAAAAVMERAAAGWRDPARRVALLRVAAGLLGRRALLLRDLRRLRQPLLVVWGAEDRLTPVALGRRLADTVPGARLVTIRACGHLPNVERPEQFRGAVSAFLDAPGEAPARC